MIVSSTEMYLSPRKTAGIIVKMLQSRRLVLGLIAMVLFAYLAELANPTFSTDYFFDISFIGSKTYAFTIDGRYLAELIRNGSGRMFPPTLLLLIGIVLLILSGLLTCVMLGVRNWLPALIACTLFTTYPLLYETFAYHALRHVVPLGFFFSVFAVLHGGIYPRWQPRLIGVGGLYMALLLYQSTVYFAIIMTVFAAGHRLLDGEDPIDTATEYVLPRAGATLVALLLYSMTLAVGASTFGIPADRLQSFASLVTNPQEFIATTSIIMTTLGEILLRDTFLFPAASKWTFLLIVALLMLGLFQRRRAAGTLNSVLATLLFLLTPMLAFGAAWASKYPQPMLADRIMIPFVAVYVGVFLVTYSINLQARKLVTAAGAIIACVFVYQSNIWHMYMDLKNRADMDLASNISERVKIQPGYRPWMPLVLIGTNDAKDYQPFRAFPIDRGLLKNSSLVSAFDQAWSSSRVLIFFLPFVGPTPEQIARMTELTQGVPAWPDPRSVMIAEDTIAVVLGR